MSAFLGWSNKQATVTLPSMALKPGEFDEELYFCADYRGQACDV